MLIGNPGVGKTFFAQDHRMARLPGQSARPVHHRHGHAQSPARFAGRSLAGPQAEDLHRAHTARRRRTRIPGARSADFESLLSGHLHAPQPETLTIITTNTPFSDWGNILFNTTIATAIADRLVENSEIFLLGGDSLRKAKRTRSAGRVTAAGSDHAPRCDDNPRGGVRRVTPQRRCRWGRGLITPALRSLFPSHVQLQRQSSAFCSRGRSTVRARCSSCRTSTRSAFTGCTTSPKPSSSAAQSYCVAGKVNSADKLYLVIESVRPDTKHSRSSTVPVPADGAGGSLMK